MNTDGRTGAIELTSASRFVCTNDNKPAYNEAVYMLPICWGNNVAGPTFSAYAFDAIAPNSFSNARFSYVVSGAIPLNS
jgi:hypothetical protein